MIFKKRLFGAISEDDEIVVDCPVLTNLNFSVEENPVRSDEDTQIFTFTWDPIGPPATNIQFVYGSTSDGSIYGDLLIPTDSPYTITLPLGTYNFQFYTVGDCNTVYSGGFTDVGLPDNPDPELTLSLRSNPGRSTDVDICDTIYTQVPCYLELATPGIIATGDRVKNTSGVGFNGNNKWYLLWISYATEDEPGYICRIDTAGYIYEMSGTCGGTTEFGIAAQPTDVEYTEDAQVVNYDESDEVIANPERGFYKHKETQSASYSPLHEESLVPLREDEKVTLVFRLFYMKDFRTTPISSDYLTNMVADFETLRLSGMKAIIRFAYSDDDNDYGTFNASKAQILAHLAQLKPILLANADVIATCQAGFIGKYGEWYYNDFFGTEGTVSGAQQTMRDDVLNTMLTNCFPTDRQVAVRTPMIKQLFTGSSTPVAPSEYFTNVAKARISHHDDAFMNGLDHEGTYTDRTADQNFLEAEGLALFNGGESNNGDNPEETTAALSIIDMQKCKFTYLNNGFQADVLAQWESEGRLDEIKKNLGYRHVIVSAQTSYYAQNILKLDMNIINRGYAPVHNERPAYIAFVSTDNVFLKQLSTDIRLWSNDENVFELIDVSDIDNGNYDLYLMLPDQYESLQGNPAYFIAMANTDMFDTVTGMNDLDLHVTVLHESPWPHAADFTVVTSGTATAYQWQENQGSGWINISNGTVGQRIYSNATTATLNILGMTVNESGWQYRCVITHSTGTTISDPANFTVILL